MSRSAPRPGVLAILLLATLAVALTPSLGWAADAGSLDKIIDGYKAKFASTESGLTQAAMGLFAGLVTLEVTYTMIKLALKNADVGEYAAELINRILFVGFFMWLLHNSSFAARAIVDSFRLAGNNAAVSMGGAGGVRPSDILDAGIKMVTMVMSAKVELSPAGVAQATALMLATVVAGVCLALCAAFLIVALVESYFIISCGVILMGFGGSRWTKDIAVKTLTYAVSVGAKIFVIQVLVAVGETMIKDMAASLNPENVQKPEDIMVILGTSVVLLVLVKTIPDIVAGLINGTGGSTGGGSMLAGAVGGAVGGAAFAAAGGIAAAAGGARLSLAQRAAEGLSNKPSFGMLGDTAARTAGNMLSSGMADLGGRLAGRNRGGSLPGRLGHDMSIKADGMRDDLAKAKKETAAREAADSARREAAAAAYPAEGVIKAAAPTSTASSGRSPADGPSGAPADTGASAAATSASVGGGANATAETVEGVRTAASEGESSAAPSAHGSPSTQSASSAASPQTSDSQAEGPITGADANRQTGDIVAPGRGGLGSRFSRRSPGTKKPDEI